MNAKQRRKLERKTPYKISLNRNTGEAWDEYHDRSISAVDWCKKTCKGEYTILNRYGDPTFKFQKQSDAVIFGLLYI